MKNYYSSEYAAKVGIYTLQKHYKKVSKPRYDHKGFQWIVEYSGAYKK